MREQFERFSLLNTEILKNLHKFTGSIMKVHGLRGSHAIYFLILQRYPSGISASQISMLCGKDKSDVSRAMTYLEGQGLIKKECANKNSYRAVYKLTESGTKVAKSVAESVNRINDFAEGNLTKEKMEIFYEVFEAIASNLREFGKLEILKR